MFGFFPLFALVIIAYNAVVFGGGLIFDAGDGDVFDQVVFSPGLMSGDTWQISLGDIFLIASLFVLFIEIVKATRTDHMSILNHGFSMIVFVVALVQFIVMDGFGNSTFFLIMTMSLLDVIAGYTVTISTARRDLGVGEGIFAGS